jgi:chromosome segregation ATPase
MAMTFTLGLRLVLAAALLSAAGAVSSEQRMASRTKMATRSHANPIRRVVDLLQKMHKQVADEGKAEEELYDKFMCYCTTGTSQLESSISSGEEKIEKVRASLEEAESRKSQLDADIKKHKSDREAGESAVAKAKALRAKEAAAFAKTASDYKTNLAAIAKAIEAISRGTAGSFLQSETSGALRRLAVDADMSAADRDALTSFLSQGGSSDYAPQSGQISGILQQMEETMEKDLKDAEASEASAISDFEALMAAKTAEIEALTTAIEQKLEASGELGLEIANMQEDSEDTVKTLAEDKAFLAELNKGCATKKQEQEERTKLRTDELLAIADTIKILNDDDALDLFKKALPSPSLLQLQVNGKEMQRSALKALRTAKGGDGRVALIAMALQRGAKGFDKVLQMIDEMVSLLAHEQDADDDKKTYCEKELDTAEDDKKVLGVKLSDLDKTIDDMKESISTLAQEISALLKGIKDLDQSVKEASQIREEENAEHKKVMQEDTAAKEILKMAKNRLAKFYAPKMYKPPAREERSTMGRISESMMSMAQTGANPGPPPETWGAYQKKDETGGGVVAMMDLLISELEKGIVAAKAEEKDAQEEYEEYVAGAAAKRAADTKAATDKAGEKSGLEASLTHAEQERKGTAKDMYMKEMLIKDLHLECDWLLSSFEVRKEARAGEVDSLTKAKAVLSGADYSLVQTATTHTLLPGSN